MKVAGGVLGIVAGVIALGAAFVTLFIGGIGSAIGANNAGLVVGLGWGGVFFSCLVIALGAACIPAKSRVPGVLLLISSILGAILGGTIVAIFMLISMLGGILAIFGGKPPKSTRELTQ